MGDILHALPAVTALRQAHPGWVIDWAVEPRWRALLAAEDSIGRVTSQPLVDRILFAPTREWRKAPLSQKTLHEIKALRQALRAGEYDAVLDLQGAVRSAVVGRMAGCRRLIGEAEPRERIARWLFTERVATRGAHVIEQDVELASAVAGDDLAPVTPWLPVDQAAEAWADQILPRDASQPGPPRTGLRPWGGEPGSPRTGPGPWGGEPGSPRTGPGPWGGEPGSPRTGPGPWGGEPGSPRTGPGPWGGEPGSPRTGPGPWGGSQAAVLINPGAGWGAKRWPIERYAAVAQGLIDRGLHVLVNAGPGEEPLGEVISHATGGAATSLTCTLEQLIALTRRVALVIAGDTGPLHLACALSRPVVGIYGPTDPSRNGPFGTRFRVLRSPESRRDHARNAAPEAGLLTISPEDVLQAADELLAQESAR
jgi:ADP-heptose:LPS heptosyltransferase